MRICFVVNNVRTQRATYTTAHLAFAAHRRGHDVAFASADALSYGHAGAVTAEVVRPPVSAFADSGVFVRGLTSSAATTERAALGDWDVVFLRNNPNVGRASAEVEVFNPGLDFGRRIKAAGALVVNDPDGLARAGSKMYLAGFPVELRPKTLITRSVDRVRAFLRELNGPAIVKPLAGFGGQNVFYMPRGQTANLAQIVSTVRRDGYVIVQEYLPQITKGDKRVLLLGGRVLRVDGRPAAYRRMRPKDDIRNNMHVGGARRAGSLSEDEERICDLLRPRLAADGLYFVGVDLVGSKVLEINVYAPGGIRNINELYGIDVGSEVIKDLERKVELKRFYPAGIGLAVLMRS